MFDSSNTYEYDVALSLAGEDREYIEKVADKLDQDDIKVFYDKFEEIDLWGKNLYDHLDDVLRKKAEYCIIFISKFYENKVWTNHERCSAQARAFEEQQEYILPVIFDDTEIPGILPTIGYSDGAKIDPYDLAVMIVEKCSNE